MAVLKDRRHEIVAQKLSSGASAEAASAAKDDNGEPIYDTAATSFAANARKRSQRPDIRARVTELQTQIAAITVVDTAWIIGKASAIGGITLDPDDIKPSDVIAALNLLAKMTPGALAPSRGELTGKDGAPLVPEYTDEERTRALEVWMARRALVAPQKP